MRVWIVAWFALGLAGTSAPSASGATAPDDAATPSDPPAWERAADARRANLESRIEGWPDGRRDRYRAAEALDERIEDHFRAANFDSAVIVAGEQLAEFRALIGDTTLPVLDVRTKLTLLTWRLGRLDEARGHADTALAIARAVHHPDHPDLTSTITNLAAVTRAAGDLPRATELYREALARYRAALGEEDPLVATALNNLAWALQQQGDLARAEPLLRRSLELRRSLRGAEHPSVATVENNLGLLLQERGRYREAETHLRRALAIRRATRGADHPDVAQSLHNLAHLLAQAGHPAEADTLYRDALAIQEARLGAAHPDVIRTRHNLARVREYLGDLAGAEALLTEVLERWREIRGPDHPDAAATANSLGRVELARGDAARAEVHLRDARRIADGALSPSHPTAITATVDLAAALRATGRDDEARALLEDAADRFEDARIRAGEGLDRVTFLAAPYPALAAVHLAAGDGDRAYLALERHHARFLRDATGVASVMGSEAAQAALHPHEALLAWLDVEPIPGAPESWAMLLRATGPPRWIRLDAPADGASPGTSAPGPHRPDAPSDPAATYRKLLRDGPGWPPDPGRDDRLDAARRALLAQRVDPVLPHLGDVTQLLVVPSGAMAGIPLDGILPLPDGAPAPRIGYVPSASILAGLRARPSAPREDVRALVVAASPGEEDALAPLRHLDAETAAIRDRVPDARVLEGDAATETALAALARSGELAGFGLVHVAAHALTDDEDPMRSCLVLASPAADRSVDAAARGDDPVDGRLTAAEILDTWTLDADLVVASACETGLGREAGGEGHVGLAQAFLAVGARAVVVSLWKVDDAATAHVMRAFYDALLPRGRDPGRSPLEALHLARAATAGFTDAAGRRHYRDPSISSAFVLVGDPGMATNR